jgi:hypothetical protein
MAMICGHICESVNFPNMALFSNLDSVAHYLFYDTIIFSCQLRHAAVALQPLILTPLILNLRVNRPGAGTETGRQRRRVASELRLGQLRCLSCSARWPSQWCVTARGSISSAKCWRFSLTENAITAPLPEDESGWLGGCSGRSGAAGSAAAFGLG